MTGTHVALVEPLLSRGTTGDTLFLLAEGTREAAGLAAATVNELVAHTPSADDVVGLGTRFAHHASNDGHLGIGGHVESGREEEEEEETITQEKEKKKKKKNRAIY